MAKRIASIAAGLLLLAAPAIGAVPAGWDNVSWNPEFMTLIGKVTVDGADFAPDNASILAVFADNVLKAGQAVPIGTYRFDSPGIDNAGAYTLTASGHDNTDPADPKNGAYDNEVLTFRFYDAPRNRVLTGVTVVNFGDAYAGPSVDNVPRVNYRTGGFDNVTLAFTSPAGGGGGGGCAAAGEPDGRTAAGLAGTCSFALIYAIFRSFRRRRG